MADEEARAEKNRTDAAIDRALRQIEAEYAAAERGEPRAVPGADRPADFGRSITSFGGFRDAASEFGGGGVGRELIRIEKDGNGLLTGGNKLMAKVRDAVKNIPKGEWVIV